MNRNHPDKLTHLSPQEQKDATLEFALILKYYKILLEPITRKQYDDTGSIEASEDIDCADWTAYFKDLYTTNVTLESIGAFTLEYQGSKEEEQDILKAYIKSKGNIEEMMGMIMCSSYKDESRFIILLKSHIESKHIEEFSLFRKQCSKKMVEKRFKTGQDEEKEALDEKAINQDKSGMDDLRSQILKRQNNRLESVIGSIEKKYKQDRNTGKEKKKGKKNATYMFEEPSDDIFNAIQAKIMKKK